MWLPETKSIVPSSSAPSATAGSLQKLKSTSSRPTCWKIPALSITSQIGRWELARNMPRTCITSLAMAAIVQPGSGRLFVLDRRHGQRLSGQCRSLEDRGAQYEGRGDEQSGYGEGQLVATGERRRGGHARRQ